MRRSMILFALLALAACGEEAMDVLDPIAANSVAPAPTAVVTVDGTEYRIGCPDYPCPVTPLVLEHIASGRYFWLPDGTLPGPAIYLYVLRVPVQLSATPVSSVVVSPSVQPPAPSLSGPSVVKGTPYGGLAQLACGNIPFTFNVPDNLPWDFESGGVEFEYVTWDAAQQQWIPTGHRSLVPLAQDDWAAMVAGTYGVIAPVGGLEYQAAFTVDLTRGEQSTSVSHTLLCSRQGSQPPAAVSVAVPTATAGEVIVCKEGSTGGPFSFSVAANTGSVNLPVGNSFDLSPDECKQVAVATAGLQSVTITEIGPPSGTVFVGVDTYRLSGSGGTQTQVGFDLPTQSVDVSPFGPDVGWVVVFTNADAPVAGCTLTQGYWKTHSEYGPAPFDDTWSQLANGADTPFFLSGESWIEVFGAPPAGGNAYYSLAHQYMAAVLNELAGAAVPSNVQDAIDDATDLFNAWTPAQIGALKGNNSLRQQFVSLAGTLAAYNEGDIGPGHCEG